MLLPDFLWFGLMFLSAKSVSFDYLSSSFELLGWLVLLLLWGEWGSASGKKINADFPRIPLHVEA